MNTPTSKQRDDAEQIAYNHLPLTDREVWVILDAETDGHDPLEHLEEYRFWRSPHGRQVQADQDFESGRY